MNLKYFYYISRTKVDMLLPQLQRRIISIPKISPKVGLAGITIGADLEKDTKDGLINDTLTLIKKLQKKKLVKPISESMDTDTFYHDSGTWFNCLFSFRNITSPLFVTYILWRSYGGSIVILVGSPANILGKEVIREGIFVPTSSLAINDFFSFVDLYIKTDDQCLSCVSTPEFRKFSGGKIDEFRFLIGRDFEVEDIKEKKSEKKEYNNPVEALLDHFSIHKYKHEQHILRDSFDYWETLPNGLPLGLFCLMFLMKLPKNNIDTIFKVYRKLDLSYSDEIPDKYIDGKPIKRLKYTTSKEGKKIELDPQLIIEKGRNKLIKQAEELGLLKYKNIFLGSPIYVALK